MLDIITQMKPATLAALIILLALGFLGAVVLKLIKSGKAKSPKDLVKVARDRAAAAKATKEAVKQAEAVIAEPIATSRLSRIAARPIGEEEIVAEDVAWESPYPDAVADEMPGETEPFDSDMASFESAETEATEHWQDEPAAPLMPANIDLADPANHPQHWDALVALVDALEVALQRPWPEDRLLPVPRFEESAADPEAAARAASQRQSAIQLARTINGAAREQAQEIIAVVRDFAHSAPFSAAECDAVMQGFGAIEWMALIERDGAVEKRTLPLTRHDPEAPLWVEEAFAAMHSDAKRAAA
jgi:hypothetical protein